MFVLRSAGDAILIKIRTEAADEVVQDFSDTRLDLQEVAVCEGGALPLLREDGVDGFFGLQGLRHLCPFQMEKISPSVFAVRFDV